LIRKKNVNLIKYILSKTLRIIIYLGKIGSLMKKLSLFLLVVFFAMIGCEKLNKEDILVEDPDLLALSQGLDSDIGLSKSSLNSLNDALNRHGKNGKHREPGFLWKVSAELQTSLSDDEKERLFGWMNDQLVPYLYGTSVADRGGKGPGADQRGGADLKMIYSVLDDNQKLALRSISESYRAQMGAVMQKVKAGTLSRDDARVELEALETAMLAEIEALLTDEQKAKIDAMLAEMKQKMDAMRKAERDAMVGALEMTSDQETSLDAINKESADAQKALMEKAKAEKMSREDIKKSLQQLIADRNSKIEALFSDKQIEIIKIYTALSMQYSKHCSGKRDGKDKDGRDGTGKK
jgi:hypothetical protein